MVRRIFTREPANREKGVEDMHNALVDHYQSLRGKDEDA
jgi:hypothetical protein